MQAVGRVLLGEVDPTINALTRSRWAAEPVALAVATTTTSFASALLIAEAIVAGSGAVPVSKSSLVTPCPCRAASRCAAGAGHRTYEQADVERLILCNRFRDSGMPIATIRRFAELVRSGPGNEQQCLELLQDHERAVRAKIVELNASLDVIPSKVTAYQHHIDDGTAAELWAPAPGR